MKKNIQNTTLKMITYSFLIVLTYACGGVAEEKETTSGSGLFNLQKRLELLYGDRYLLHTKLENGWYIAELIFPLYAD